MNVEISEYALSLYALAEQADEAVSRCRYLSEDSLDNAEYESARREYEDLRVERSRAWAGFRGAFGACLDRAREALPIAGAHTE
jgi:hypothetical protein